MDHDPTLERLADGFAPDVAALLEALDRCDDPDRLRAALKVVVTALPDLLVTVDPAPAILATTRQALEGDWP